MSAGDELSTHLTSTVLDQLADTVAVLDDQWRYRYVSDAAGAVLGLDPEAAVGGRVWDLLPGIVGTAPAVTLQTAMRDKRTERLEWREEHEDGSPAGTFRLLAVPTGGGGLLVLVDDVTEQRRSEQRSERLVAVGEALAGAASPVEVNRIVGEQALPLVGAGGSILISDDERDVLNPVGWVGVPGSETWRTQPQGRTRVAAEVLASGRPAWLTSLDDVAALSPASAERLRRVGQRGLAALPLDASGRSLGVLVVLFPSSRALSRGERQFLTTTAAMAAQALVRVQLYDVEKRSIDALQRSLLPRALPPVAGLQTAVRYVASDAAAQIGGDWYDVVPLRAGSVALVMGDVEGHDLGAAALMGLVRSAVRSYALEGHPPAIVVARANAFLATLDLERIVTLSYLQLHPAERLVTAVSAGHPSVLVVGLDGALDQIPAEIGPPLGVFDEGQRWPETTSTLPDGAALAMFTDGLVEVRGQDVDAGTARVGAVMQAHAQDSPDDLADLILGTRGGGHDDVALLVARLEVQGESPRRLSRRMPPTPATVPLSRAFARQLLAAWGVPAEVVERAELIVSELVTNAARHSEDVVEIGLAHLGSHVRLEVGDTSHRMPVSALTAVPDDATSGRGLLLVDVLASRWGVTSEDLAKRVWAELDL